MRILRQFTFPFLIGILLLVLAACGSSATATPSSQATADPTATGTGATVGEGETFEFQFACINRTLKPCELMMEMADAVRLRTNGQLDIQISSFPELGLAGPDTLRLLQDGTLDFGEIYGGYVSGDFPAIEMGELLGLFESSAMQEEVFRALREDEIRMVRDQFGAEVISYIYYPDQFIWSKTPLRTLDDFDGLKVRTHSTALGDLAAGLGAEGQFIAFSEVYTALERGILDAGVTGSTPGYGQKWYEVSKYLVGPLTSHPHVMVAMNKGRWDSLPSNLQQILKEEAAKTEAKNLRVVKGWDQEGVDLSVAEGMEYIPFTPEIQAGIREAVLNRIVPNWAARAGGYGSEAVNIYNAKVAPIVGVVINPDGSASATEMAMTETELVSSGLSFKFQYACINRTLNPCELLAAPGGMLDRIRERTNGQVDIQISSFPELGLAGPDTLRLIEDGTLGMAEIYSGYVGGDYPAIDAANLWGLIPNNDVNLKIIDAVAEPVKADLLEKFGAVVIGEMYYPNNYYYSGRPLRTVADFEGMKTRSHSTVLADLINGMGADAQFMAFSEVYTGLERGILDAAVTCGVCGAGLRWFEVTDYLVGPIVALGVTYMSVNKDRWDEIPADLQNIVLEEGIRHQAVNRVLVVDAWVKEGIDDNVGGGMEYIEFTPEIKEALKKAAMEKVVPNWVERVGGADTDAVKLYNTYVAPLLGVSIDANGQAVEN